MITATRPGVRHGHLTLATVSASTVSEDGLDYIAVERAVNGDTPADMTVAEQIEAARILTLHGSGPTEIGLRLGVTKHQVMSWRDHGWTQPAKGRPAKAVR